MAVNHNIAIQRVKELRELYADALRRKDLEGFFRNIALHEVSLLEARQFQETIVEPLRKVA